MELSLKQIIELANKAYPKKTSVGVPPQMAYVKGFCAGMRQAKLPAPLDGEDFLTTVAEGLRLIWPAGEKSGKYPWRDSTKNIVKRLEFIWNERKLGEKYTVEDCLRAGRRYVAQFQDDTKYMQILKYFIFKQEKSVSTDDGHITYTYSSKFADFLEDATANEAQKLEESVSSEFSDLENLDYGGGVLVC